MMKRVVGGRNVSGWIPDRPDHRDVDPAAPQGLRSPLRVSPMEKGFRIDSQTDLTGYAPPVREQGDLGSCTGQAGAGIYGYLWRKRGLTPQDFSPLYLYAETRKNMGVPLTEDSGASIRETVKTLAHNGCCFEKTWPYFTLKYSVDPPRPADEEAEHYQALRYYRLSNLDWLRACTTLGFPIIFGMTVFERFMSTGNDGQVYYPTPTEKAIGGHAMFIVGHDDYRVNDYGDIGAFLCQNSWGFDWGMGGRCWVPYTYWRDLLAMDCWTLHSIEGAVF